MVTAFRSSNKRWINRKKWWAPSYVAGWCDGYPFNCYKCEALCFPIPSKIKDRTTGDIIFVIPMDYRAPKYAIKEWETLGETEFFLKYAVK